MKAECGYVDGSFIQHLWWAVKSVFATRRWCRENGFPSTRYYGVYEHGTNHILAMCGPTPDAEVRAKIITKALNERGDTAGVSDE